MALKEFYELGWRKVIITILLFLIVGLYLLFFGDLFIMCKSSATCGTSISTYIIFLIFFWPTLLLGWLFSTIFYRSTSLTDVPLFILAVIINGFYFYTLGCLIDLIIQKIKSR